MATVGSASPLAMVPDRATIAADGRDLSFVTVAVRDAAGRTIAGAKPTITFTIDGRGEIVAIDNGDPTDLVSFATPRRAAFNGLALVIVRGVPGRGGTVTVKATADGLKAGEATIRTR